jgi:hypothetical protein
MYKMSSMRMFPDTLSPINPISVRFESVTQPSLMGGSGGSDLMEVLQRAQQYRSNLRGGAVNVGGDDDDDYGYDDDMYGGAKKKSATGKKKEMNLGFKTIIDIRQFLKDSGKYNDLRHIDLGSIAKLVVDDIKKEMKEEKVNQAVYNAALARVKAKHAEYVARFNKMKGGYTSPYRFAM